MSVERRSATNVEKVVKVEAKAMEETAEAEDEVAETNSKASSKGNVATATNMVTSHDVVRQDYTMKNRRR
jgi:hypothetical protein